MSISLANLYEEMSHLHSSQIGDLCAKHITADMYIQDPAGVQQFFLDALHEIELFDDYSTDEIYSVLRVAYLVTDFKFNYTLGYFKPSFKLVDVKDPQEIKAKFLNLMDTDDLRVSLHYWPGYNPANFREEDALAVAHVYPRLTDYNWAGPSADSSTFDQTFNMLGYLLKHSDSDTKTRELKIAALPLLGYSRLNPDEHPEQRLLLNIGYELYGPTFDSIFNLAKSLDLASNKHFWNSHLIADVTTSIACPEF